MRSDLEDTRELALIDDGDGGRIDSRMLNLRAMSSRRWHSRTTCSTLLTTRILSFDFAGPFKFPAESSAIIETLAFLDLL